MACLGNTKTEASKTFRASPSLVVEQWRMADTFAFDDEDGVRGGQDALLAVDGLAGPGALIRLAHVPDGDDTEAILARGGHAGLGRNVAPVEAPVDERHRVADGTARDVHCLTLHGVDHLLRRLGDGRGRASNFIGFILAVEFTITVETLWNALVTREALVLSHSAWGPRNVITAVSLICTITTVVVTITKVNLQDAFLVVTLHFIRFAQGGLSAIVLVRPVLAVKVPITDVLPRNALSVLTGSFVMFASS